MNLATTKIRHHPFRVPSDAEVSDYDREAAAELWSDHLARERRERRDGLHALAEKLERQRALLRETLGGDGYAALGRLKEDFRTRLRHSRRLPQGYTTTYDQQRDEWTEQMRGFADGYRFRPEMVREPFADLFNDLVKLHPHPDRFADYVYDYGGSAPSEPDNPWRTFKPPFTGWQSGWDTGLVDDFSTGRTELLNAATGHVGNILTLDCGDADNFSCGSIWADTQVAFWFTAPKTGLVEVAIVAHCGEARHYLHVRDEWGVSDYGVSQKAYLMMHCIHGAVRGPTYGEVSSLRIDGDYSTFRDEQHILPGETVSVTLASDSPVAVGDKFVIRAGARSEDGIILNDMEVNSRTTFSWFLSSVSVRIKP